MKLCIDCKHWQGQTNVHDDFGTCHHPSNTSPAKIDLISGELVSEFTRKDPYDLRYTDNIDVCGEPGRWWEQKAV